MKKNPELHDYSLVPIYENHAHMTEEIMLIDDTVTVFRDIMAHFNYGKLQVCSIPFYNRTENYKGFYVKSNLKPSVYVSVGLDHHLDERDTADYYLSEIKKYYAMGCDGIKMLEGKMKNHRKIGKPLCDPVFDKFYAFAEEKEIPIIIHLGDPLELWDITKCSQYAIEKGWYCDENDPTRDELRKEITDVLVKFPKLHIIFAHFNFMGDELERAAAMFDKWENICFDLTPGGEMYVSFTENYKQARAFFETYQDRILYGTDIYAFMPVTASTEDRGKRANLVRSYLEKKEPFYEPSVKKELMPFGFSEEILSKIYRDNFVRLYGENPRPLEYELIARECHNLLSENSFDELNTNNLQTMIAHFEKNM